MVRLVAFLFTISLITLPAYAVPNIWKSEFGQGFLVININNESGDEFTITCDLGYTETGEKTSASFKLGNGSDLSPSSKNKVEIVIDGNSYFIPEGVGFRSGDISWESFISVINTANNFDIYVNDKIKASFHPTPQSTKKELSDLTKCTYRPRDS
ncbi:hypothetical protein [Aeromonas hydrophila]|uniref:hypothetical protein n=1 Tax=Aeromonas hydrophila TaxID=644 RepID=UPI00214F0C8E|nr:hypothetical protein [Aeromonas hydrophila]MCR3953521.1 hypothetical protein [Aeromonas hydrophila]MCW4617288.1 hypothetical protein [Aeromonas hydrophila]